MESQTIVDPSQVKTPLVTCTSMALSQLELIAENDFTLKGKYLRILISGKGCDGFTYSIGFTDLKSDDIRIRIKSEAGDDAEREVIMDPFTAFYLQRCLVDYKQDFAHNEEGFTVENLNQRKFSGKFWISEEGQDKVPPTKG